MNSELNEPRAYSLAEVAKMARKHPATIYRLVYIGKLKKLKGFATAHFSRAEVERLFSDSETYQG